MTQPQVTIIGLGLIGESIGLGLSASAKSIRIVGHDRDPGQSKLVQKKGAVHQVRLNLLDACQDADLVIIATPITAVRETLEVIGPHLKRGCVVTDTAALKEPVLAWAAEMLPDGVPFVGGDPLLHPNIHHDASTALQASADLLDNALYVLCPAIETPPTAVKRVADMVSLLKARPFFVDPTEHDGMRAAVEGLPTLAGLAVMQAISEAPGWREARKLADHILGTTTATLASNVEAHRAQILLNAHHLLPHVDTLINELTRLRARITAQDASALDEAFEQAASARTHWLTDRAKGDWEEELAELGISGTLGSLGSMIGFGAGQRKPKED